MYLTPTIFTDKPEVPEHCIAIGTPTLETVRVLDPDTFKIVDREGYLYAKVLVKITEGVVDLKTCIWMTQEQVAHMSRTEKAAEERVADLKVKALSKLRPGRTTPTAC